MTYKIEIFETPEAIEAVHEVETYTGMCAVLDQAVADGKSYEAFNKINGEWRRLVRHYGRKEKRPA